MIGQSRYSNATLKFRIMHLNKRLTPLCRSLLVAVINQGLEIKGLNLKSGVYGKWLSNFVLIIGCDCVRRNN